MRRPLMPHLQACFGITSGGQQGPGCGQHRLMGLDRGSVWQLCHEYPGLVLKGKVSHISPASGSQFALLPPDNATGNFTKVTQRIPVKIILYENQESARLRPGLSVVAVVRTGTASR